MQQLILGTGTAIWWLTEPHWNFSDANAKLIISKVNITMEVNGSRLTCHNTATITVVIF